MQAISDELVALLKSKFQAGASGFRGKVVFPSGTWYPTTIDIDHSLAAPASQLTAVFTNEDGEVGLTADAFPVNALFTAWEWYGAEENAVCTFTGFVDKVEEHRDPRTVTITCRDWMKPLLVQDMITIAPQGNDEIGANRTTSNLVYLDMDIADIVTDLLNKAGYPLAARSIQPTNYVVKEWTGNDGTSYADGLGELADIVAFRAFADELGVFKFQADGKVDGPVDTETPPVPVYTFKTGEDIVALDPERDDYETKTRIKATGPFTTLQDAWTELWHTNVIVNPTGVMYEPADPTILYVADGPLKKVFKITQGAEAPIEIVSSSGVLVTTYLNGLSGDPSDADVFWTLDTPWIVTGTPTLNKIRKHLKTDGTVLATFSIASQQWTDMKVGADGIWLANFTTNRIHKLDKTTGAELASYTVTDSFTDGGTRTPTGVKTKPIGLAIDGTILYMAFYNEHTMLVGTTINPSDISRVLEFSGTKSLGGDIDTTTHTELYACSGGLSLVYKYTMKEAVTNDVSVEVVNSQLEAALGVALDTGVEIRRLMVRLDVITTFAQATETAARWLDKLDQFRNVLDVGIIGNPAIQKADMVRVEDPVTGIANDFQVDTYRSTLQADGTYLGTLALLPWTSSYSGPGDVYPVFEIPPDTPTMANAAGMRTYGATDWQHVAIPSVEAGAVLYAVIFDIDKGAAAQTATWCPSGIVDGEAQVMTKIADEELTTGGHTWYMAVYKLETPAPGNGAGGIHGRVAFGSLSDAHTGYGAWYCTGVSSEAVVFDNGSGTGSSIATGAGPADMVLDCVGWYYNGGTYPQPTVASGQTADWRIGASGAGGGEPNIGWAGGHMAVEDPAAWSLSVSRAWLGCAIVVSE